MQVKNISIRKFFFLPLLLVLISCSNEKSWNFSDGVKFPEGTQLSRAEDGVILSNGTLIVADQRYGLAKIDLAGNVTPFGDFEALDYEHNPPKSESGPNGVHLSPDNQYVITADVFNGKIYKTSIENNSTEIIYAHKYGTNTAREDSTGSLWFTQSTENQNEERLFGALDKAIPDGALYRLPISEDGTLSAPEPILENLYFANGFYIDEKRNKFYLSEMMKNRVLAFDLDITTGSLTNQTTLAIMPTPDNMELNSEGQLWVASPLSNQIYSIDPENGESYIVFDAQTEIGFENMEEGIKRMETGGGFAELLTPELTGEMPGLLTGMIIGDESQPFYVANLGTALIKVSKE
jgi:sugar lactone lactonase YvrE